MTVSPILKAGESRVWIIEDGASPNNEPEYMGIMKTGDPSWGFGDITTIKVPDPNRYNGFIEAANVRGARERVTSSLVGRYPLSLSTLLRLARKQCRIDVQIAWGQCRNPQDYTNGWEKLVVLQDVEITTYNGENWGALGDDEQNPSNENVDISAEDMFEVVSMYFKQLASTLTTREITAVMVCDNVSCGDCDDPSDGCEKVFATMIGTGATPGTKPSLLYTKNGGSTWGSTTITTLFSTETPRGIACVGNYVVIVSNDSDSLHYAYKADILTGVETWYETFTGFVIGKDPYAIWSADANHTWMVGEGGYIYFTADPTNFVTVQDAGISTAQTLYDVHAYDSEHAVAVGGSNAVVYTQDGFVWKSVLGPEPGIQLNAVWMLDTTKWLIGSASGKLWFTADSGGSWTNFAPTPVTNIYDIWFVCDTIGYFSAVIGANGYIFRTTNGGNSWYRIPRSGTGIPTNARLNKIAACEENHNIIFAGGLASGSAAGIIIKGS